MGKILISLWNCNKELYDLKRRDFYNFIELIKLVVGFIKKEFNMIDPILRFCTALYKCKYIYWLIYRKKSVGVDDTGKTQ